MQNIVYVAHTHERELKRARFSILNLMHFSTEMELRHRIIVYTDSPSHFSDLDVLIEEMDNITISMWQGASASKERIRIMAMRDAFATYHGNVIMVGNETFYLDNPAPLFLELSEGSSLMYEELTHLADLSITLPKQIAYLTTEPYKKIEEKQLDAPPAHTSIFESAAIGIHENDRQLVKKTLCYFDALLAYMPEKIASMVAFSFVLGNNTLLQEANDWVDFFDAENRIADSLIQQFFKENDGLHMEALPTEAWRLAHQFDGSVKYCHNNIINLVRELIE